MAPSKRRRNIDDDGGSDAAGDDEQVLDLQTAQSHRRQSNNKRPRTMLAAENGGSVVSDASSDVEGNDEEEANGNESNSDDENTVEDAIMSQIGQSVEYKDWLNTDKENIAAEYGVIEEVLCQNFMCHEKLRIRLGPLINFIIGHNGSGKSAVLTALTLCLGVKATATNRGASLKNFIREGQDHAMLSVKIKNQGDLAYQHHLYGDSIYVERHFNRAGASSFKIKNADERLITTKKADLEDMLDYLGLQLDNPLNVLSQDMARQFLSNSTPHDKYKFFLKGTQLEQLDRDYRLMHDCIDQTEEKLFARKNDIAVLKSRYEKAAEKKKLMDQAGTLHERIVHMAWMHAWAQVEGVERELEKAEEKVAEAEQDLIRRKQQAEAKSDEYASKDGNVEAAKQVKQDLESEVEPIVEQRDKIKEEFDKNKQSLLDNQTQMRHMKTDLTSAKAEVSKQQKNIEDEQRRIESASGPAQAEKLAELRQAEQDAAEKKEEYAQLSKAALDKEQADAEVVVRSARDSLGPSRERVGAAQNRLESLQRSRGDPMKGFHQNMPRLLRAIQQETRFREKPVGPIGIHVKLKKPEWSSIVESTFGGVLDAFVVTSTHDQGILRTLQQRSECHGDIYIGDPRPIDVSRNSADSAQDTLLNVLEIGNDLIRNQFIINQQAEQTVLIKDRQTAHDYMYSVPRPANVKSVLCMHDHIRGEGHRFANTANGQRMDRVRPWNRSSRIQTDIEVQIRNQQENVNDAKRRFDTEEQGVRQHELRVKKAKEALVRFGREQRELRIASQQADDRVEELKAELERFTIDAGTLESFKEALYEAQEQETLNTNSYTDALEEKARINDQQKEVMARLDKATKSVEMLQAKIKKVETSLAKHDKARTDALREMNLAYGFAETAEKAKEEAEAARDGTSAKLDGYVEQANTVHARVPVEQGMNADLIDKRLEKLVAEQRTAEERIGGTREEIARAHHKAKSEWRHADHELGDLTRLSNSLKKAYYKRHATWVRFRRWITARAKFTFAMLLNERNFKGNLETDHENKAMDIHVEPDMTTRSEKGRQAKTLSGGEKSFSTICLLLAIWEAMGSPIRCLDEFDVFMDSVNRDTSMRMMIQAARRATGKQYILITPQSMGNVPVDSDIRIHRMSDPERGQTALAFA